MDVIETKEREVSDTSKTPDKSLRELKKDVKTMENPTKKFFDYFKAGVSVLVGIGATKLASEQIQKIPNKIVQNPVVSNATVTASLYGVKKVAKISNEYFDYAYVGSVARTGLVGLFEVLKMVLKNEKPLGNTVSGILGV